MNIRANIKKEGAKRLPGRYESFGISPGNRISEYTFQTALLIINELSAI
jgi:hypothetical protein